MISRQHRSPKERGVRSLRPAAAGPRLLQQVEVRVTPAPAPAMPRPIPPAPPPPPAAAIVRRAVLVVADVPTLDAVVGDATIGSRAFGGSADVLPCRPRRCWRWEWWAPSGGCQSVSHDSSGGGKSVRPPPPPPPPPPPVAVPTVRPLPALSMGSLVVAPAPAIAAANSGSSWRTPVTPGDVCDDAAATAATAAAAVPVGAAVAVAVA